MNYVEFKDDVTECIRLKVDGAYEVKLNHVVKNNSVELDGVVFFKEDETISPNIYLNVYYERFLRGESVESIAEEIIELYQNSIDVNLSDYEDFSYTLDHMKDKIIFRLVNYKQNKALLEDVPHIRFLDLAITFHCVVRQDEDGIGSIRITNEHMQLWDVTTSDLLRFANANTERKFPVVIRSMQEVIREMLKKEFVISGEGAFDELDDITEEEIQKGEPPMYIMSNACGINGATAMIYKNAIKNFAYQKESDFYILPSSIHEVILVPISEELKKEQLIQMVRDVNQTQVPKQEILSNQVYVYHRRSNTISL